MRSRILRLMAWTFDRVMAGLVGMMVNEVIGPNGGLFGDWVGKSDQLKIGIFTK